MASACITFNLSSTLIYMVNNKYYYPAKRTVSIMNKIKISLSIKTLPPRPPLLSLPISYSSFLNSLLLLKKRWVRLRTQARRSTMFLMSPLACINKEAPGGLMMMAVQSELVINSF